MGKRSSIAVLVSGGLDSTALLAEMAQLYRRVYPIYVRQGLSWELDEIHALRHFLRAIRPPRALQPLTVLSVPMADVYGAHWSMGGKRIPGRQSQDSAVYLPGRNLALSVKAAVFCSLKKIPVLAIGSLNHNPFSDASPGFFKLWSRALSRGLNFPIRVEAPYRTQSKAQVIRRHRGLPLHLSFSCIAPKRALHCGACNKCAERQRAYREAGVKDRTRYA